jgi:hypothetical protein
MFKSRKKKLMEEYYKHVQEIDLYIKVIQPLSNIQIKLEAISKTITEIRNRPIQKE